MQDSLQAFKNKIREQSKGKIREQFYIKDTVFATLPNDEVLNIIHDLEEEIYKKHPEADHYYLKRICDVCENIKFLKDYKDISSLMAVKKSLSYGKLL